LPQFFANPQIFCGKMLDGGVEKAHKTVRANEPATSERATGKENFPDGKKKFLTRV